MSERDIGAALDSLTGNENRLGVYGFWGEGCMQHWTSRRCVFLRLERVMMAHL